MRDGGGLAPWRATGRATALLLALVVQARAQEETPLVVSPAGRAVEMRVGERRGFTAMLAEPGVQYSWIVDGAAIGGGNQFEFRPTATHVGRHEISVTAIAGSVAARHTWRVTVEAVGAPKIVRAAPGMAVVRLPADELLQFELEVEPATLTDRVSVRWTVDGSPAGEGHHIAVRAPATGSHRVRAVATSEYGGAVVREWQLVTTARANVEALAPASDVVPDPELAEIVRRAKPEEPTLPPPVKAAPPPVNPPREPAAKKDAAAPQEAVVSKEAAVEREATLPKKVRAPKEPVPAPPVQTASVAPPRAPVPPPPPAPPAPPPPPTGVTEDDVRALMFRYEQAWRTRNAAELRRIGHVDTDEQESALARYFATTRDLEVAVHVLELRIDGARGTVRFTRRDRFRDPAGREMNTESPPIEKTIVRTPEGVRFSPRS